MKIVVSVVLSVLLIAVLPSAAQDLPGRGRGGFPPPGPGPGFGVDILRVDPIELSEPVLDAPYSAETITEMVQLLADGNRIEQRTTGSVARNRRGRIRLEQSIAGFGAAAADEPIRIVTITDPVRREQYRLDERRKIAWRSRLPAPPRRDDRGGGRPPLLPRQSLRTDVLDQTTFDGVKADGTRAVLVLPPGTIGNERAIEVISERWYSPELKTVVATKRLDPRFGDVSYQLVNIVRGDPPAHLFEIPPDFTIRDQPPFPPPPGPR